MESTSAWMEISFKVCSNQSKSRQKENDVLVKRLPATHLFMPCLKIPTKKHKSKDKITYLKSHLFIYEGLGPRT